MLQEAPVTAVQESARRRRWRARLGWLVLALIFLVGLVASTLGLTLLWQLGGDRTTRYADDVDHFKYGSIGAEPESGIPYRIWQALPTLFPERFAGRSDYSAFGFLYEPDGSGEMRELPVGISRREVRGVEVVWLNCATCHTGTWRAEAGGARWLVPAMPSNNLDLYGFIRFLLDAGADERLAPDRLIPAMEATTGDLGWFEKLIYRWYVIPAVREGLIMRRSRLLPLLAEQPAWGPGRVDTFNPYKLVQMGIPAHALDPKERFGTADFPAVFEQGPREGMALHWDGNNRSLEERNLSAALGAGVTAETADHAAIERVAEWLRRLRAPASPYQVEPAAAERGKSLYMRDCAQCHGYQDAGGFVFKGARLGEVEPNAGLGVDPGRLDSYTTRLRDYQLAEFFEGTPYDFRHFEKTDGYANLPLDGLWLRAPYLHNGSVPTLADLLAPPEARPRDFRRGLDTLDAARGGFLSPSCSSTAQGFCFDTSLPGNGNGGHRYGMTLAATEKADLLAYLLTF